MREGSPSSDSASRNLSPIIALGQRSSTLKKTTKNSYPSSSYNFRLDPRFCAKLPPLPDRDEIAGTRKKIKKLAS